MKNVSSERPGFQIPKEVLKEMSSLEDVEYLFKDLFKQAVEAMLEAEMTEHLGYEKHDASGRNGGNSRNGHTSKTISTSNIGELLLRQPRDREGTFEPMIVPKHQRISADIEQTIIGLYATSMSTSDISSQIRDIYGVDVSPSTVSGVTNKLLDNIREWQKRPLESVYMVVWIDAIRLKVRHNGSVHNKCVYLMLGMNNRGFKDILGMWIDISESATFWLSVFSDIKARGVEDILIACTDNLKGYGQALEASFANVRHQLCIVHQIRNSCAFVGYKDRKEFCADLKTIYTAPTEQAGREALEVASKKWSKYAAAFESWSRNWAALSTMFDFPPEIRKIMYTTNAIESVNSRIRRFSNAKYQFPDDNAAMKAVYFSIQALLKKWTQPIPNWGLILNQFMIIFGERCRL
jgi:transposase-like protein